MPEHLTLVQTRPMTRTTTARDVAAVFFRQRRVLLVAFAVVFCAILAYGFISPSYQATMKILLRRGRVDAVASATPSQPFPFLRQEVSEEELNSAELLKDEDILRAAVHSAGEDRRAKPWFEIIHDDSDQSRIDHAVRRVSSRFQVNPVRKSNIIEITYSSSDPIQSALLLQCLAQAYLERHQKIRRSSGKLNFFEEQVTQARNSLTEAEASLVDFSRDHGVVSAALERDTALHRLTETESDEAQVRGAIGETVQRIRTLESKLRSLPERITTSVRSSDNPLLLEKIKSKLLDLQLKRTELLTKFDPSYRLVQEVEQQISETEAAILANPQLGMQQQTPLVPESVNSMTGIT